MIWQVQNRLHYTGDYISKESSVLSSSYYPEQNANYLDKVFLVPYKDENDIVTNYRLFISKVQHPEFVGVPGPRDNYTKVLRFDLVEPYVGIMVDKDDRIIVGDTRDFLNYTIYPGYIYESFRGFPEAAMTMTKNWLDFNIEYNSERILLIHVQNKEFLGQPVYVEYYKDLFELDSSHNILETPVAKDFEDGRYNNKLNQTYRTTEKGYIIRADENGDEAKIVVMVVNEETGERKYVLGNEAYFYMDTEEERVDIGDLNLWQTV